MKVIIVEVTRAANSFGRRRTCPTSARPTARIADIVPHAQADGTFRDR